MEKHTPGHKGVLGKAPSLYRIQAEQAEEQNKN